MSYLDNQISAFKSNLTSSSSKISNKRSVVAPPKSAPSPAPSQESSSSKHELKRKRPEPTNVVYSQPADTGTGNNIMTQITYAIEHLKRKGTTQTIDDILSYLSLLNREDLYKKTIAQILRGHEKVEYSSREGGTYRFRPIHNIRSGEALLRHLQSQSTAQGVNVRDLRDGWAGAEDVINQLEAQGKLLVTRNKKDNHAKMVWPNDPSLIQSVDEEFQALWHKVRLPEPTDLVHELEKAGLTPANKNKVAKAGPKIQEKKRKNPRAGGKKTNLHMEGVLKDYSGMRKK